MLSKVTTPLMKTGDEENGYVFMQDDKPDAPQYEGGEGGLKEPHPAVSEGTTGFCFGGLAWLIFGLLISHRKPEMDALKEGDDDAFKYINTVVFIYKLQFILGTFSIPAIVIQHPSGMSAVSFCFLCLSVYFAIVQFSNISTVNGVYATEHGKFSGEYGDLPTIMMWMLWLYFGPLILVCCLGCCAACLMVAAGAAK